MSEARPLTRRALNRATLARQMLSERADIPVIQALQQLFGVQAQAPHAPYPGLWTRLKDFQPEQLSALLEDRTVVRSPLMRATIHLVTARDCIALRPLMQPVLERSHASTRWAKAVSPAERMRVLEEAACILGHEPVTRASLLALLARQYPGLDATALAYAITALVPVVQVPPRGLWGRAGSARWMTVDAWLGRRNMEPMTEAELVLRYLGAFGPASVRDIQIWCGVTRLRRAVEGLRHQLIEFRDERGTVLFDVPDAPRPDPDVQVPPRFLPEYDNLLFAHADRSRVNPEKRPVPLFAGNGGTQGTLLVDGDWKGSWKVERPAGGVRLDIQTFTSVSRQDRKAIEEEGEALLQFLAPHRTSRDVVIRRQ